MEGVTAEAASPAGHLGLGKLIYLYDQNGITLAGSTTLTFSEDIMARFAAYGWESAIPQFVPGDGPMATRKTIGKVLDCFLKCSKT